MEMCCFLNEIQKTQYNRPFKGTCQAKWTQPSAPLLYHLYDLKQITQPPSLHFLACDRTFTS